MGWENVAGEIKLLAVVDRSKVKKITFRKGGRVIVFDRFPEQRPESCWYGLNGWLWAVTSKEYLDKLGYQSYFGGFRQSLIESIIHAFKKLDEREEKLNLYEEKLNLYKEYLKEVE